MSDEIQRILGALEAKMEAANKRIARFEEAADKRFARLEAAWIVIGASAVALVAAVLLKSAGMI